MEFYELILPYPPSNNHHTGIVRKPRRQKISSRTGKPLMQFFIPEETQSFRDQVFNHFLIQNGIRMGKLRLRVEIDAHPPKGKRGYDIDNYPKEILDSLAKAGAYANDSQIECLLVTKKRKVLNGKIKVRIGEFNKKRNFRFKTKKIKIAK